MIVFTNKKTDITQTNGEKLEHITYADLVIICLNITPPGGYTIEEMTERLPIMSMFKAIRKEESGIVELGELQVKKIINLVNEMSGRWAFMHQDVIDFSNYVNTLNQNENSSD